MLAGFAEREYTPDEGVVPGQIKVMYAKGKRTPLMAHVAVIDNGRTGSVLISLDLIFTSSAFAKKIRQKASEITGIPYENIMFVCTHTHTGCGMDCDVWQYRADPSCMDVIEAKTVEAITAAYENRIPVKMGVATGFDTRFHYCRDFYTVDGYIAMNPGRHPERLLKPYAAIDHSLNVMRLDDMNGSPKCFIVNYANHLDTSPTKEKFDADFPGYIRRELQKEYGEDVTVLFLNGCCANINHYDYMNSYDTTHYTKEGVYPPESIGIGLADNIIHNIQPLLVTSDREPMIQGVSRMFLVPRRIATAEDKEWARKKLEELGSEEDLNSSALMKYILANLYLSQDENTPTTVNLEIQALQIGDWAIIGLPGEIYSDIGLKIKANSPFANTVVVELANGYEGYMASDTALKGRCYETTLSTVSYTGYGTDKTIVDGASGLLNALFESENAVRFGALRENPRK